MYCTKQQILIKHYIYAVMIPARWWIPVAMLSATAGTLLSAVVTTTIVMCYRTDDDVEELRVMYDRVFLASVALVFFMLSASCAVFGCLTQPDSTKETDIKLL